MALLGNIIWFILGGWWSFLVYALLGVIFCITIIGIPIGKSLFQYAKLMALPFGKVIVKETFIKGEENVSTIRKVGGIIANILWLPFGIATFLANIALMIVFAISIIGIPVAIVIAKSCKFLLWPIGAKVISKDEADRIQMQRSMQSAVWVQPAPQTVVIQQPVPQTSGMQQTVVQQPTPQVTVVQQPTPQVTVVQQPAPQVAVVQPATSQAAQTQTYSATTASPKQPNQTMENLKATGTQAFDSLKENGSKAASVIVATGVAGLAALKEKQKTVEEQISVKDTSVPFEDLLSQTEVKLYKNKVTSWIMPFLEYITIALGVLFILIGVIVLAIWNPQDGFFLSLLGGAFYGLKLAIPIALIAGILGMIKQNHIFVLVILAVEAVALLGVSLFGFSGEWFAVVCLCGIIAWYIIFVMKKGSVSLTKMTTAQETATSVKPEMSSADTVPGGKRFCVKCGAELDEQVKFCPKCGASQTR